MEYKKINSKLILLYYKLFIKELFLNNYISNLQNDNMYKLHNLRFDQNQNQNSKL